MFLLSSNPFNMFACTTIFRVKLKHNRTKQLENFKNCAEMEEFPNLGDKTCEAEKCIEIERDSINDYSYIECDNCKEWFHCLCEGKFILLTLVFSTIQLK